MMSEMQRLIDAQDESAADRSQLGGGANRLGELSAISRGLHHGVNESSFVDPDAQHYSPQFSLTKDLIDEA